MQKQAQKRKKMQRSEIPILYRERKWKKKRRKKRRNRKKLALKTTKKAAAAPSMEHCIVLKKVYSF
jgi:hypothetical protein